MNYCHPQIPIFIKIKNIKKVLTLFFMQMQFCDFFNLFIFHTNATLIISLIIFFHQIIWMDKIRDLVTCQFFSLHHLLELKIFDCF